MHHLDAYAFHTPIVILSARFKIFFLSFSAVVWAAWGGGLEKIVVRRRTAPAKILAPVAEGTIAGLRDGSWKIREWGHMPAEHIKRLP
jgi:hypothetical protein